MQIGPYRVVEEIARGGMGVVYRAQGADGKDVALKLLLARRSTDPRARQRFKHEVQALARLRHPNVVSILGAGDHAGSPWLALHFVQGESLEARLRQGPLPIWEAIRVAQQLAQALSYVHSCGLLHRDLKPDNVLLRGGQALLTDFGLVLDDQSSVSRLTATGVFQGTPGYWSPEQAGGRIHEFAPTTDVYGLGAVLYACLTGQPPVEALSLQEYLQTVKFKLLEPPRRVRAEVPEWLSELCMRCLAVDPSKRPGSADEVARALVMAGGKVEGAARRPRAGALLGTAGVLGVLGLVALGLWARGDAPPAAPASTDDSASVQRVERPLPLSDLPEVNALVVSGTEHLRRERYPEALRDYERAIELDPDYPVAYAGRGDTFHRLERYDEAIEDYDRALARDPSFAKAYAARGEVKLRLGRYDDALRDYDRAIELVPGFTLAHMWRGEVKATTGRYDDAIRDYDRALELDPSYLKAYLRRGDARCMLKRSTEAIADYQKALELDPWNADAHVGRGLVRLSEERFADAVEEFDLALELKLPKAKEDQVKTLRTRAAAQLAKRSDTPFPSTE